MTFLLVIAVLFAVSVSQICDEVCTGVSSPVCGSDGLTYFNECTLKQKACLEKSSLKVIGNGECFAPECAAITCSPGKLCVPQPKQCITTPCDQFECLSIEEASCANIVCPQSTTCVHEPKECLTTPCPQYSCDTIEDCNLGCPLFNQPVCGSNFKTYSNQCLLEADACLTKSKIFTIFNGECSMINCETICDAIYQPVCGSDGITYGNLCQLKSQSCRLKTPITVANQGECECDEMCAEIFEPVCGINLKTYSNECTLRIESCHTKNQISILHEGECQPKDFPVSWETMLKFDVNNDLLISRAEFDSFINTLKPETSDAEKDKLFVKVDLDGNNQIDQSEYQKSESIIQESMNPSSNTHLFIGIGVGVVAVALVVLVVGAIFYKKRSKTDHNRLTTNTQTYDSLE